MNEKTIKIILIAVAIVVLASILLLAVGAVLLNIIYSRIPFKELNEPMEYNVISAKQIEAYLVNEIHNIDNLDKYDLTIGSISMKLDKEHRGEVEVIFVERNSQNSKVIIANLDTQEGILYKFQDLGRESKLYPGVIDLQDWEIDSTDAVRIFEEFFCDDEDFLYDEIRLYTYSDSLIDYQGKEEYWMVSLIDEEKNICYNIRINAYSGEITSHTIGNLIIDKE